MDCNDSDYLSDNEREEILDDLFPDRHNDDFDDDDDGIGSLLAD